MAATTGSAPSMVTFVFLPLIVQEPIVIQSKCEKLKSRIRLIRSVAFAVNLFATLTRALLGRPFPPNTYFPRIGYYYY